MRSETHAAPGRETETTIVIARALQDPSAPMRLTSGVTVAALVDTAMRHRVLLLLGWTIRAATTLKDWPPDFIAAFRQAELEALVIECVRHAEFVRMLDTLSSAPVRVLPFKGVALARTHYPVPYVRVRTDTDILVAAADVPAVEKALCSLGYVRPPQTSGRLVSYQGHYQKTDRHGVFHALDVHWKISNMQALADRFTFEELWANRVPLPGLSSSAATVADVHALLLALVHRAGHHPGARDLLWIYDLHLLAGRLTPEQIEQVRELARTRGLSELAYEGLSVARQWFDSSAIERAVDAADGKPAHRQSAPVIRHQLRKVDVLRLDLDALPDWRARWRLLREHVFPPASYMRAKYGVSRSLLLPLLYVWRVILGAPRWFRNDDAEDS